MSEKIRWPNSVRESFLKKARTSTVPLRIIAELHGVPSTTAFYWAEQAGIKVQRTPMKPRKYNKYVVACTNPEEIQKALNGWGR